MPALQALEWVADNARPPAVLSMSVAGELSLAVNEAVRQLVESHGITVRGWGLGWKVGESWWATSFCLTFTFLGAAPPHPPQASALCSVLDFLCEGCWCAHAGGGGCGQWLYRGL